MGTSINFNKDNFYYSSKNGLCNPLNSLTPFYNIDFKRFYKLYQSSTIDLDFDQLKRRLGIRYYNHVLNNYRYTTGYSQNYFPAFQLFAGEFLNKEWLATVDWRKYHRDHILHQTMTAYIGMILIKGKYYDTNTKKIKKILFNGKSILNHIIDIILLSPKCQYLRDYFVSLGGSNHLITDSSICRQVWRNIVCETFFLAALFHDLGYPWYYSYNINQQLNLLSNNHDSVNDVSDLVFDLYKNKLWLFPFNGYQPLNNIVPSNWQPKLNRLIRKGLTKTHGLPGAVTFLQFVDELRKYPDNQISPIRLFCIDWAAMAIMMHDMSRLYGEVEGNNLNITNQHLRISFEKDPLSFMLTISDQIQDFSRPDAIFTSIDSDSAKVQYKSNCHEVELSWDESKGILDIINKYRHMKDYSRNKTEFLPKIQKLIFNSSLGYLDYAYLGISYIKIDAMKT